MPKKVKTKKQKILADSRRNSSVPALHTSESHTYSLPIAHASRIKTLPQHEDTHSNPQQTTSVSTAGYQYLTKDLTKTLILTGAIIIAQLLIRYLIN